MGRSLAQRYLDAGHTVGVCGGGRDAFACAWPDPPAGLSFCDLDVTDRGACVRVIGAFGEPGLDLLLACAGVNNGVPRDRVGLSDFTRSLEIIDVNLKGVMHAFEGALRVMLPRGRGRLAAVSSAACFLGNAGTGAYAASKLGVARYCETLGLELEGSGVGVTCVAPGYVDTPMARAMNPEFERVPFAMTPDAAAARIERAIERGVVFEVFPLPVRAMGWWMKLAPRGLYRWRVRRRARRREGGAGVRAGEVVS
jgi:NAD(P)-dependent dehydrogenase (short-subunit alcohol dehydrogenase family)